MVSIGSALFARHRWPGMGIRIVQGTAELLRKLVFRTSTLPLVMFLQYEKLVFNPARNAHLAPLFQRSSALLVNAR